MIKQRINEVLKILENNYGDYACGLNFKTPFEMLVATVLSAQCTDTRVNKVTDELFRTYNSPEQFACLSQQELERLIKSCGLYKTKASNIISMARILTEKHGGQVPNDFESLCSLPGVGRKTANVVLANAFGADTIAVDTHVFRVSNRLGLAKSTNPHQTEQQLMKAIPKQYWSRAHHWLIWHGRRICHSRKPDCAACPLKNLCENYLKND